MTQGSGGQGSSKRPSSLDWAGIGKSVLISQPVHIQAYETVVAAQEAGMLNRFVTGLYRTGRDLSSPRLMSILPGALRDWVESRQRRRWHPDIDSASVSTIPLYHLVSLAARATVPAWDIEGWAHQRFDAAVARHLPGYTGVRLVHAWEGAAWATFKAARTLGVGRILDVASPYERSLKVIVEEGGRPYPASMLHLLQKERQLADHIFAPSKFVAECLIENGVEPKRIIEIPYGADTARFRPVDDARDRPFRCLFVGLIGLRKGIRYILEAWRELELADAELVLVGALGSHGEALLNHRPPSVRWVGQVPFHEVHRWFQESDVFVFPSLSEGSAMVTYQAMATGLPVVTTLNSGSVVRDRVDGYIIPPRDSSAIAASIRQLYLNPEERRTMGVAGRKRISDAFTWGHYRRRVGAAYRAILAGQDPKATVAQLPESDISGAG